MAGDWTCMVNGDVVRVDREDLDKSGRNPKLLYTVFVRHVSIDGAPEDARLPAELACRVTAADLAKQGQAVPVAGDRVSMTVRGNGPQPRLLAVVKLQRVGAAVG